MSSAFARLSAALAALLAPAVIVAVDPRGWYPFGPLRWLTVTTLVLAAGALAAATRDRPIRLPRTLGWACAVFVSAMAVSALVGVDGRYAWTGTPEREAGVALWLLCVVALGLGAVSDGNRLLRPGLVAAGLALGATATAEALGWEPDVFDVGSRLTGLMGSSAFLGAAAALLLPIAVGVTVESRPRGLRAAAGAATVTLLVALVGSGARAAWVGTAVAALIAGWARRPSLGRIVRAASPLSRAAVAAVALVGLGAVVVVSPAGTRVAALFDDDAAGGSGRLDEWRVATRVIARHPLTGVGPEGYRIAFAEGVDAEYEARHGRDPLPDRAHSGPLDIALAGGPVALGAWLAILAVVGRSGWGALRSGGASRVGVAAGLLAHWVGQLFLFPFSGLEPIAWFLAGWLVATGRPASEVPVGREQWAVRRVAAPVLATLSVGALVLGGLGVAADRRAREAAGTGSVVAADGAVALRPDVVRHHLLLARVRVANGDGRLSAIEAVDDALAVSPGDPIARLAKAQYLVERAVATEVPAHVDEARREVWAFLADDPLHTQVWALAVVVAAIDQR